MIEEILESRNLSSKYEPYSVYSYISYLKNHPQQQDLFVSKDMAIQLSPAFYDTHEKLSQSSNIQKFFQSEGWPSNWLQDVNEVTHEYQQTIFGERAIDYDDMLLIVHQKINKADFKLGKAGTLIVDDIQDFNWLQYEIYKKYQLEAREVYIVSDPNYRVNDFRSGGNTTTRLIQDNPNIRVIELDPRSFRSTHTNVLISGVLRNESFKYPLCKGEYSEMNVPYYQINRYIEKMEDYRYHKTTSSEGLSIAILETDNEWTECDRIAEFIQYILRIDQEEGSEGGKYRLQDVLLLFPKYWQGKDLEHELRSRRVPSTLVGGYKEGDEHIENPFKSDTVKITSLYKSKGIEAKIVIIIGMEDPKSDQHIAYREGQVNAMLHIGINRAREFTLLCWTGSRNGHIYTKKPWPE